MEPSARPRIEWLDTAKACGMFLVFYGHFVERVYDLGNQAALAQQKLIYAFHMPLFVVLAGVLARTGPELPALGAFLKRQAASRLLPVLFFSVLLMPFAALLDDGGWAPERLKAEYVDDWVDLGRRLSPPAQGEQPLARLRLWEGLPAQVQALLVRSAAGDSLDAAGRAAVIEALNAELGRPGLFNPADLAGIRVAARDQERLSAGLAGATEDEVRRFQIGLYFRVLYPEYFEDEDSALGDWGRKALMTLKGYTEFNVPVWFLVCLFTLELYHYLVVRLLPTPGRIVLAIPLFFAAGWYLTRDMEGWGKDFWFVRESVFLYAFYLGGYLLRRTEALSRGGGRWSAWPLFLGASAVLWFTFDLNPGSRIFKPVVLINLSQHGDLFYFALAAVAGSLALIGLGRVLPQARLLQYLGRHSLVLMGLNGLFFDYLNVPMVQALGLPPEPWVILAGCTAVTVFSLALCLPVVRVLDRYLPQLVGRPRVQGPLLPRLVT